MKFFNRFGYVISYTEKYTRSLHTYICFLQRKHVRVFVSAHIHLQVNLSTYRINEHAQYNEQVIGQFQRRELLRFFRVRFSAYNCLSAAGESSPWQTAKPRKGRDADVEGRLLTPTGSKLFTGNLDIIIWQCITFPSLLFQYNICGELWIG